MHWRSCHCSVWSVAGAAASSASSPTSAASGSIAAERVLAQQKLDWREDGASGVAALVRSNWKVCGQAPAPGKLARRVILRVGKSCGGTPTHAVSAAPRLPWLDGTNLDDAKEQLDAMGITYSVDTDDGDSVLVDRLWTVCTQSPDGGTRARFVELRVAHDCSEY